MSYPDASNHAGRHHTIDPALWSQADLRPVFTAQDIGLLYRVLKDEAGLSQRQIARLTGQSQSQVSEILAGRQVVSYEALARIAEGLGVPRERMGLSWWGPDGTWHGPGDAYPDEVTVANTPKEVNEDMRRRALITAVPVFVWGHPLFGEVPDLPAAAWTGEALPSRLGMADVARVDQLTDHVRELARRHGGQAGIVHAAVTDSMRLLAVPAPDPVTAKLGSALARLLTLAGWCCADSGVGDHLWYRLQQAMELAASVGDTYRLVEALRHAGALQREQGQPNDALKVLQLGEHKLLAGPRGDPRTAVLAAWLRGESALALAAMGRDANEVSSALAAARGDWEPPNNFERSGMDELTARVHLGLGRLDVAESFAAGAVRVSGAAERRNGVLASVTLATIHVRAAEPGGILLAKTAIDGVRGLRSVRARRQWLRPLTEALETRPSADYRELAQMARQVTATRA